MSHCITILYLYKLLAYTISMLKKLALPLFCVLFFLVLIVIWNLLGLPSEEELVEVAREYFFTYGLITIFIASLIESMLVVGWYLPGGLIIFLGVILSAGNPKQAALSVLCTIAGLSLGYIANYFLGYYGWYKLFTKFGLSKSLNKAKEQFQKHGYKAIYMSYWQPNLAALVSTSAGVMKASRKKFILTSTTATIIWSSFWGISAYFLGEKILSYLGIVFFGIMGIWIIKIIIDHKRKPDSLI